MTVLHFPSGCRLKMVLGTVLLGTCVMAYGASAVAQRVDVQYQKRGNWYEGVRGKPISSKGKVELISLLVDYQDQPTTLPEEPKIKFFLEKDDDCFLTIREQQYQHYYWLDQVQSEAHWKAGFENVFVWSAKPVLYKLDQHMDLYDLGAVVRIGYDKPAPVEYVAPAVLYHTNPPKKIDAYLFRLQVNVLAKLSFAVKKTGSSRAIWKQPSKIIQGGVPFTIRWDAAEAVPGPYEFRVKGNSLTNAQRISKTIRFFHQPDVD